MPVFARFTVRPAAYPPVATAQSPDRRSAAREPAAARRRAGTPAPDRICTSGGGIRAAAWTAALLGRLDEVPGARKAVRVITGASGGMVGAASWVARLHARGGDPAETAPAGSWEDLLDAVAMNSLTPLARRLVFRDLPLAFAPVDNLHDRGRALEDAWVANLRKRMAIDLDLPLGQLRDGERLGQLPSLVFSPMLVEDGRRLIISNRDLRAVTDSEARWLSGSDSAQPYTGRNSRGAYHLSDLLPDDWAAHPPGHRRPPVRLVPLHQPGGRAAHPAPPPRRRRRLLRRVRPGPAVQPAARGADRSGAAAGAGLGHPAAADPGQRLPAEPESRPRPARPRSRPRPRGGAAARPGRLHHPHRRAAGRPRGGQPVPQRRPAGDVVPAVPGSATPTSSPPPCSSSGARPRSAGT